MAERLQSYAGELQKRTNKIRTEMERPATPDDDTASMVSGAPGPNQPTKKTSVLRPDPLPDEDEDGNFVNGLPVWQKLVYHVRNARLPETIDPYGRFYLAWLIIVSSAVLYNAYSIPLRVTFPYQTPENLWFWLTLDYLCDLIYILDIVLAKPRLVFISGGLTIKDPRQLKRRYLFSTTFKLDLLALLPLDVFYAIFGVQPLFRLPRVLKVGSYFECFASLDNIVKNVVVLRISKTLSYMVYIIHVNACAFYALSAWQAFGYLGYIVDGKWKPNTWVYQNKGWAYIRCFYFTTKLATSIGNNPQPTNVVECLYVTFSWLMGVFVFAILLGQIRDIVATASRNQSTTISGTVSNPNDVEGGVPEAHGRGPVPLLPAPPPPGAPGQSAGVVHPDLAPAEDTRYPFTL